MPPVAARCFGEPKSTLFRGAEDHEGTGAEVRAKVNQMVYVLPAFFAQFPIRRRDVKRSWSYQDKVQTYE
jgi:hypothetical protein